jgi:hypothetical protein
MQLISRGRDSKCAWQAEKSHTTSNELAVAVGWSMPITGILDIYTVISLMTW